MIVVSPLAKAHSHTTTRYIKHTTPAPNNYHSTISTETETQLYFGIIENAKKYGTFSVVVLRSTYSQLVRAYRFIAVIAT